MLRVRRRLMLWLTLLATVIAFAASWKWSHWQAQHQLQAALQSWQAAGGKMHARELAAAELSPTDNAAPVYRSAVQLLPALDYADLHAMKYPWTSSASQRQLLAQRAAHALELAQLAAAKPACTWPIDYEAANATTRGHLTGMRQLASLGVVQAFAAMDSGAHDQAVRSLELVVELASDVGSDPELISSATQRAIDLQVLQGCQLLFSETAAELEPIARMLAQRGYRQRTRQGLLAEGTVWLTGNGSTSNRLHGEDLFAGDLQLQNETVQYLRCLSAMADYFAQPYFMQRIDTPLPQPPRWAMLAHHIRADRSSFAVQASEVEARATLLQLALRLRNYKRANQQYPDQLAQLGQLPTDPLGGGSFLYQREGEGFLLCSVGMSAASEPVQWRWTR